LIFYLLIATPLSLKRQRWLASDAVGTNLGDDTVKSSVLYASVIVAALAAPVAAQAQGGFPGGFAQGANEGYRVAGPIGAVVAAPVGGVIGGVRGFFGVDNPPPPRPRAQRVRTVRRNY
jgi:hypothetical protein